MRLLDAYAIQCGAKIDKPFLLESYFPMSKERYITFQAQSKFPAKDYDYWQAVINMLSPVLTQNGIKIIQVGQLNERPYQRVADMRGQTNFQQLAYLLKRSELHFGPDSLPIHIASSYDIPLVGLYSVSSTEVSGPHFGSSDNQVLFKCYERVGNGKPSYAAQEDPKSVNSIKPEEIANAIFKLLKIDFQMNFKTIHTGPKYSSQIIRELVPDALVMIPDAHLPIEIRMDINHNEKILARQLSYLEKSVVITSKPIDINLLKHFKPNISMFVYKVPQDDSPEFVRSVINAGINVLLVSDLTGKELEAKKIQYYEFGKIHALVKPPTDLVNKLKGEKNLFYHSSKLIASQGKIYGSHAARENQTFLQNDVEYSKVIDSQSFWDDLDFYTIVQKND